MIFQRSRRPDHGGLPRAPGSLRRAGTPPCTQTARNEAGQKEGCASYAHARLRGYTPWPFRKTTDSRHTKRIAPSKPREAFEAIAAGAKRSYPGGRFRGVEQIPREDLGLAAIKSEPALADEIRKRLNDAGGSAESAPSIRFVLNWGTGATTTWTFTSSTAREDSNPHLPSGGNLYADVTTGYGPECFTMRKPKSARSWP